MTKAQKEQKAKSLKSKRQELRSCDRLKIYEMQRVKNDVIAQLLYPQMMSRTYFVCGSAKKTWKYCFRSIENDDGPKLMIRSVEIYPRSIPRRVRLWSRLFSFGQ